MNNKQFAVVAAITFLVGMIWLAADIIFNTKASIPISPKLQTLLDPVNPNFNPRVLDLINNEVSEKSPEEVPQQQPVETAPVVPTSKQSSTESAQIEP